MTTRATIVDRQPLSLCMHWFQFVRQITHLFDVNVVRFSLSQHDRPTYNCSVEANLKIHQLVWTNLSVNGRDKDKSCSVNNLDGDLDSTQTDALGNTPTPMLL